MKEFESIAKDIQNPIAGLNFDFFIQNYDPNNTLWFARRTVGSLMWSLRYKIMAKISDKANE